MSYKLNKLRKESANNLKNLGENVKTELNIYTTRLDNHLEKVQNEYVRVAELSHNAPAIIDDIDHKFKEQTKLSNSDIVFLFLCTALQCARQYLLTNDMFRVDHAQGDKIINKMYSSTVGKVAPPDWERVLFSSVPYDVTQKSIDLTEDIGIGGASHRYRTLGHDPVLGWIFGTANIMTNSLTKHDFKNTYQVAGNQIQEQYPLGTLGMLSDAAEYAMNSPKLLAVSVARQAIHFGTDYFTKSGLPIPLVMTVNNDLAKTMITKGNIDMWSVTRSGVLAALINQLIAVIHRLFYDENRDGCETSYEVRTRKILSYSNALATGSNVIVTAFTKDMTKLDVGGMINTLYRLISDYSFIQSVKRDFLKNEIYKMVVGDQYDFMEE